MTTWETIRQTLYKKSTDGGAEASDTRGYHMEFQFKNIDEARALCDMLAEHDIFAKLTTTPDNQHFRVYIKDSDSICNLLALAGANKTLFKLQDQIALRSVRNVSNRRANCDAANVGKQVTAAARQIEVIKSLKNIPKNLESTASARIENPEASYEELGTILGISKSSVAHRLKRLLTICDK